MVAVDKILENHRNVVENGFVATGGLKYRSYAISTLRGGVGKSTLAFNLAYEMAGQRTMLIADLCAQCNLTETLMRESDISVTILDVLQPRLLGPAFGDAPSDPSYRVSATCDGFKSRKSCHLIPGNALMFAFPSTMYQQLQIANAQVNPIAVKKLLECLKDALDDEANSKKSTGILMDTSPFYAGGTHLAWRGPLPAGLEVEQQRQAAARQASPVAESRPAGSGSHHREAYSVEFCSGVPGAQHGLPAMPASGQQRVQSRGQYLASPCKLMGGNRLRTRSLSFVQISQIAQLPADVDAVAAGGAQTCCH
jgi:hypothetical protein